MWSWESRMQYKVQICCCHAICINCIALVKLLHSKNNNNNDDLLPVSGKSMTVHYYLLFHFIFFIVLAARARWKKSMGRHCPVLWAKQLKRQMARTGRQSSERQTWNTSRTTASVNNKHSETTSKWCTLMADAFLNFYDSSLSASKWVCVWVSECVCAWVCACVSVHGWKGLLSK